MEKEQIVIDKEVYDALVNNQKKKNNIGFYVFMFFFALALLYDIWVVIFEVLTHGQNGSLFTFVGLLASTFFACMTMCFLKAKN